MKTRLKSSKLTSPDKIIYSIVVNLLHLAGFLTILQAFLCNIYVYMQKIKQNSDLALPLFQSKH